MKTKTVTLACPACNTPVFIEVSQLILGTRFTCSNCQAAIGLAQNSKSIVEEAVQSYTSLTSTPKK
ncbi:transcription initiation factor IIE alpha subunit [Myroides gitamensis]|uniref:Uncharacterized protein n=1 Tax=Myroides odoratus TaxID=256 RepID=A0A378RK66_MYROD|nr:hypothetical protein [Myroides odoratus]MCS4238567.1 transcription initiation factor IIE alpha subunit [Myroides odoratus]MDH6600500.1 transcription initiation factor IIE alpha subunit [Myroides gitamensis]STZ27365.1 Uncharacterised protein [Myroides odoratus]